MLEWEVKGNSTLDDGLESWNSSRLHQCDFLHVA
jgi:hypothetical protein